MAAKLTLSIDPEVVAAAKRYASGVGTSVSQLVEDYLAAIAAPADSAPDAPVLTRLRGSMHGGNVNDHRRHLAKKYR
jgi:hypothetical protein